MRAGGCLGTEGTVNGGRYQGLLEQGGAEVEALACPCLWHWLKRLDRGPIATALQSDTVVPSVESDTVILGYHYPLLAPILQDCSQTPCSLIRQATARSFIALL